MSKADRNEACFTPGYVDDDGYWHSARSKCCSHWLVTYNATVKAKVHWPGFDEAPLDLECRCCGKRVWEQGS